MKRLRAMFGLGKKPNAQAAPAVAAAAAGGGAANAAGVGPLPPAPALPDPLEEILSTTKTIRVGNENAESPFRYILKSNLPVKLVLYHPADNPIYAYSDKVKLEIVETNVETIFKKYHGEFTKKYNELLNDQNSTIADFNRLFDKFESLQHPLDDKDIKTIDFPIYLVKEPDNILGRMFLVDLEDHVIIRFQINGNPVTKDIIRKYTQVKLQTRSNAPKQTNANVRNNSAEPGAGGMAAPAVAGVAVEVGGANGRNDQAGGSRRRARRSKTKRRRAAKKRRGTTRR